MNYRRLSVYVLKKIAIENWDNLSILQEVYAALASRKTPLGEQLCEMVAVQVKHITEQSLSPKASEPASVVSVHRCETCHKGLRVQLDRAFAQGFSCPNCGTRYITQIKRDEERCPYKILGVEEGVPQAEIVHAYRLRIKEYHVDRLQGMAPALYAFAEEALKQINLAFERLKQPKKSS